MAGLATLHRVSGILPRRRGPPRGCKIGGGQRILRIFVRYGAVCGWFGLPTGIVAAALFPLQSFGHELIKHPGAGLRS